MNDPRYKDDIENARTTLSPMVLRLKGLIQAWSIFHSTEELANAFEKSFEHIGWQSKMAFTKAVVSEYIKPWQSNNGKALKSLQKGGKIDFLEPVVSGSAVHSAMNELRQQSVAHTNEIFEAININLLGAEVVNELPSGGRQEGTLERVFIPIGPELSVQRGMWWLNSPDLLRDIVALVQSCKEATKVEIIQFGAAFRDECMEHMHVLHELGDQFTLGNLPPNGVDERGNPSIDFEFSTSPSGKITQNSPKPSKIGDTNISSSVLLYQPSPTIQSAVDVKGKGYHLRMTLNKSTGQMVFNISFPKYPFPAAPT